MRVTFALFSLVLVASGCDTPSLTTEDSTQAVKSCKPNEYPCGPYGLTTGSVIQNFVLTGKTDSNGDGRVDAADAQTTFSFADDFNRTDKKKLPKVLALNLAAGWCAPCQAEAATFLNPLAQAYEAAGAKVDLLTVLVQNNAAAPPTIHDLDVWGARFHASYDLAIDDGQVLAPLITAYPTHLVVRTADMQIVYASQGADTTAWQAAIDAALAE